MSASAHRGPSLGSGIVVAVTLLGEVEQLLAKLAGESLGQIGDDLGEAASVSVGQGPGGT